MSNEEILTKAIEKAISNGYLDTEEGKIMLDIYGVSYFLNNDKHYYSLIFSHDFAKAFFKNEGRHKCHINCNTYECFDIDGSDDWEGNLCDMVLEPDPIYYLEKYL